MLIYLSSIEAYFPNDPTFQYNYAISRAAAGKYKDAEPALVGLQSAAGAEELVSVEFADGEVLDYRKLSKTASLLGPLRSCERSNGSGRRRQRRRRPQCRCGHRS